jgi:hypothetical protein
MRPDSPRIIQNEARYFGAAEIDADAQNFPLLWRPTRDNQLAT